MAVQASARCCGVPTAAAAAARLFQRSQRPTHDRPGHNDAADHAKVLSWQLLLKAGREPVRLRSCLILAYQGHTTCRTDTADGAPLIIGAAVTIVGEP
jgi:hypothetical protein